MKNFYYLFVFLIFCSQKGDLDYLLGHWQRTNDAQGRQTFEYWEKSKDGFYKGLGYTLQGKDTVFKENLRILKIDGVWNYEVTGVNPEPTYFKFIEQKTKGFVCVNPDNDFPKKISYTINKNKLIAIISNDTSKISFHFLKAK